MQPTLASQIVLPDKAMLVLTEADKRIYKSCLFSKVWFDQKKKEDAEAMIAFKKASEDLEVARHRTNEAWRYARFMKKDMLRLQHKVCRKYKKLMTDGEKNAAENRNRNNASGASVIPMLE